VTFYEIEMFVTIFERRSTFFSHSLYFNTSFRSCFIKSKQATKARKKKMKSQSR
jgi:hypothetical protein